MSERSAKWTGASGRETGVRCMWMRGGTSKGGYFLAEDLPADAAARDAFLLRVMGSPDTRQIDGMGGADPLTSKVAVVEALRAAGRRRRLSLPAGLRGPADRHRRAELRQHPRRHRPLRDRARPRRARRTARPTSASSWRTPGRSPSRPWRRPAAASPMRATARIDGVPGTAAAIPIVFEDTAGSSCGALLPTGRAVDVIDGVEATLIDNGMPCVVMRAGDLGITGEEAPKALEANDDAAARAGSDPAQGRAADEPRRRRGEIGAEDDDGLRASATAARFRPAPSSRIAATRRSACSARSPSPPPACCRRAPPLRSPMTGEGARALALDRAPDRRDDRRRDTWAKTATSSAPRSCAPRASSSTAWCSAIEAGRRTDGAGGGSRTRMAFQPRDFKSLASTGFATPA